MVIEDQIVHLLVVCWTECRFSSKSRMPYHEATFQISNDFAYTLFNGAKNALKYSRVSQWTFLCHLIPAPSTPGSRFQIPGSNILFSITIRYLIPAILKATIFTTFATENRRIRGSSLKSSVKERQKSQQISRMLHSVSDNEGDQAVGYQIVTIKDI